MGVQGSCRHAEQNSESCQDQCLLIDIQVDLPVIESQYLDGCQFSFSLRDIGGSQREQDHEGQRCRHDDQQVYDHIDQGKSGLELRLQV